jgi:hypothetical protein
LIGGLVASLASIQPRVPDRDRIIETVRIADGDESLTTVVAFYYGATAQPGPAPDGS